MDEYIRRIEEYELPKLRKKLAPLEDGSVRHATAAGKGPWVDDTGAWAAELKQAIAMYEAIVARHRKTGVS